MPVNHRFYRHLCSFDFVFVELEDNELFLLYSVIIRELIIPIFLLVTI